MANRRRSDDSDEGYQPPVFQRVNPSGGGVTNWGALGAPSRPIGRANSDQLIEPDVNDPRNSLSFTGPDGKLYMRLGSDQLAQHAQEFKGSVQSNPNDPLVRQYGPYMDLATYDKIKSPGESLSSFLPLLVGGIGAGGILSGLGGIGGIGSESLIGGAGSDTLGGAAAGGGLTGTAGIPGLGEFVPGYVAEGGLAAGIPGLSTVTPTLGGAAGVGAGAASGALGAPFQPNFNLLDPSTYGGSGATGSTATTQAAQSAAQNALGRIMNGTGTAADYASILGTAGSTALGYLGAQNQVDAFKDVAAQDRAIGAPYRDKLLASYGPGFNLLSQPGYGDALSKIADISARSYGASFGNPAENQTAQTGILKDVWNQGYLPAMSNYRGQLGQFGGLGLNTSSQAAMAGASQAGGTYDALGYGLGALTSPQNSLQDLLKQLGSAYRLPGSTI